MNDELEIVRGFLKERLDIDPARMMPEATLEELDIDSLMSAGTVLRVRGEARTRRLSKDLANAEDHWSADRNRQAPADRRRGALSRGKSDA